MAKDRRPYRGYLTKRRNRWAVKVAVPRDIVESGRYLTASGEPRRSVVRILEAGSHSAAVTEAHAEAIKIKADFADILKGLPVSDASARRIAEAVGRETHLQLSARQILDRNLLPDIADELKYHLVFGADTAQPNPLLSGATIGNYARTRLARLGIPATEESVDKLAELIVEAQRNAIDMVQKGQRLIDVPTQPRTPKAHTGPAGEIEALAEKWMAEKRYPVKRAYQHRRKLAVLYEHHRTAAEIDRRTAGHFVTDVLAKRAKGRKGRTMISATTIGSYLTTYTQLWKWMERRGHVESNPWTNQRMDQNGEDDVEGDRRGFTEEEGSAFLGSMKAVDRDVAMVAAVTGMRLEEIACLTAKDVAVGRHVVWLTIPKGKTTAAARRVPVVTASVRKMLAKRKAAGKGRLFHELKADRFGDYGSALSKRVGRKLRSIGLTDPNLVADHSWRHRARTLMERAEVAPWVADWVLGHERPGEGLGRYSEGPSDEQMIGAVKAVTLPA